MKEGMGLKDKRCQAGGGAGRESYRQEDRAIFKQPLLGQRTLSSQAHRQETCAPSHNLSLGCRWDGSPGLWACGSALTGSQTLCGHLGWGAQTLPLGVPGKMGSGSNDGGPVTVGFQVEVSSSVAASCNWCVQSSLGDGHREMSAPARSSWSCRPWPLSPLLGGQCHLPQGLTMLTKFVAPLNKP